MKLERKDSMTRPVTPVTPVTRRISFSVMSPRPPFMVEPMMKDEEAEDLVEKEVDRFDSVTENQLTRFDSEVESVNEANEVSLSTEIQPVTLDDGSPHEVGDVITASLPGCFISGYSKFLLKSSCSQIDFNSLTGSVPSESKDNVTRTKSRNLQQATGHSYRP